MPEEDRSDWRYRIAFFMPLVFLALWDTLLYNSLGEFVARRGIDHSALLATWLDIAIPFVPLFSVPYLLAWLMPPAAALFLWFRRVRLAEMYRIYLAFIVLFAVHDAAWIAFPVEAHFRLADWMPHPSGPFERLALWIHEDSSPWNSFPSMHVAAPWLLVRVMQMYTRRGQGWLLAVFGAVAVSTLCLKLHYFGDVVAGWAVAEGVYRWVLAPAHRADWRPNLGHAASITVCAALIAGIIILAVWCAHVLPSPATYVHRTASGASIEAFTGHLRRFECRLVRIRRYLPRERV
jgi:membrane-associated phospholipid phosphatase